MFSDRISRHVVLILSTIRYGFSWVRFNYYGGMARFSYRFAFLAAATTYGIVVYKTFKARAKAGARNPGIIGLASDENVQYLSKALLRTPPIIRDLPRC